MGVFQIPKAFPDALQEQLTTLQKTVNKFLEQNQQLVEQTQKKDERKPVNWSRCCSTRSAPDLTSTAKSVSIPCFYPLDQSHDHQFNWWFGDAPERGGLLAPPKDSAESTILAASQGGYFSVLLSFLDSSSCSRMYFRIVSSSTLPIVDT